MASALLSLLFIGFANRWLISWSDRKAAASIRIQFQAIKIVDDLSVLPRY